MYEVYLIPDYLYKMNGNVLLPYRPEGTNETFPELVWLSFAEYGSSVVRIQTPGKILYNHPQFLWYLKTMQDRGINISKLYWTPKPVTLVEIEK